MKKVFILVPSFCSDSPIKGAVALANELMKNCSVCLVSLKGGDEKLLTTLRTEVTLISLGQYSSWFKKLRSYKRLLSEAGEKKNVLSISSCFSADMLNRYCSGKSITCASVRGNLPRVYRMNFGMLGIPLAILHLLALNKFDHVVAMTNAMAEQLRTYVYRPISIIGNFIDEFEMPKSQANFSNEGPYRFIFVASLFPNKQVLLLIRAFHQLVSEDVNCVLDIIGDGPQRLEVEHEIEMLKVSDKVNLHGYINQPFKHLIAADVMVLPSLTEGISRSVLEALYLGVPCVVRDIDGNSELIQDGENGALFEQDQDLAPTMKRIAFWSRARQKDLVSLLPDNFRQHVATQKYIDFFEMN